MMVPAPVVRLAALGPFFAALTGFVLSGLACQNAERTSSSEPATSAAPAPSAAPPAPSASRPVPAASPPATAPPASAAPASREPPTSAAVPAPFAPPAVETTLTFFDVQGVAADDVLNVRFNPDSSALLLASIPASARRIEGIGAPSFVGSTRWQRVRYAGTIGWVNARFLAPDEGATRPGPSGASAQASLLAPLVCFGTEPFWDIRFGADGSATCGAMCEGPPGLRLANLRTSPSGEPDTFDILTADERVYLRVAMRKTGQCSDGMSDFSYPYEFAGVGMPGSLSGCCRRADTPPGENR